MRKRIFLAVSTSDLATRKRIFFPPCRIRSTALEAGEGRRLEWSIHHGSGLGAAGLLGAPGMRTPHPATLSAQGALVGLWGCRRSESGLVTKPPLACL